MSWLLTHMWMALAAVGLFALLLGWSVRGILLVGKLRTARVDRDVARTELEQARAEIEGLYAAQRNTAPGASDPALKAELNVREKRMAELSSELSRSKAELESLKTSAGRGSATTAAAASARPATIAADEEPSLVWRNRHLESRVRHLESALHQPTGAAAATVAGVGAAAVAGMASDAGAAETDKLKWQADVLKQRVEALEAELSAQPAADASPAQPVAGVDANEELARLRWRNRFLEGRIAYFEGDSESATEDATDESQPDDGAELVSATDAILTELEEADAAADADETELSDDDDFEDEAEADNEAEAEAEAEDEDGVEEDEDDAADFDDALEADDESGDDDEDDESDDDAEYEDDEESEDGESDDDDDSDDDESDDDEDSDEDEADEGDVDDDDDDAEDDDESEEGDVDEDAVDEDGDDEDEADEEDLDSDDEDDAGESDEAEDEIAAERPIALEKPVADTPDDLTIIGGIGPKIQEVLNELGIFHYDQIAAWSPENIAWVDRHLNFSGRISREGWVEQAAILSGDVADE
ncbi:hypothetical protein [Hyphomonas sp.]|uniref:hypothetical protein n=1 Tax=Hyphomonas sp. TaxID=87 RepID=UPI0030F7868B